MASSSKHAGSSKNKNKAEDSAPPTVGSIILKRLSTTKDLEEKFPTANPRLPASSVAVPDEDVLSNLANAARLLQEALTRTSISEPILGANTYLRSPRPEDKQLKRRHFSVAGENNKRAKIDAPESSLVAMVTGPPSGTVIDTVMIDDNEEVSDEGAYLHRRQRSSSSQHDA
ncbi:uncharacterized protein [Nicotiana tomentosiformis]|uniref:uncharacterized protein n=1 Tax=Nicotiana tomentosiformis TaxID=4098 RepID=UPI00388C9C02